MRCFVSGGAGFIGSHLVSALMNRGIEVIAYDNLSLGKKEFIERHLKNKKFTFVYADLLDLKKVKQWMKNVDVVFHMAANSDISYGEKYTDTDLKQGTVVTYNVLEAMRVNDVKEIVYASSSTVFGDMGTKKIAEEDGPLLPISLYGASKLAAEALISAFCYNYDMKGWIFRFANIVGENTTHGVVHDFVKKLRKNPRELEILGDGKQRKPYLYVKECVEGILYGYEHAKDTVNVLNLGSASTTTVDKIAQIVVGEMNLKNVKFKYTGGPRGWKSDVPQVRFNVEKMKKLGWQPKLSSDEAVRVAVKAILSKKK